MTKKVTTEKEDLEMAELPEIDNAALSHLKIFYVVFYAYDGFSKKQQIMEIKNHVFYRGEEQWRVGDIKAITLEFKNLMTEERDELTIVGHILNLYLTMIEGKVDVCELAVKEVLTFT